MAPALSLLRRVPRLPQLLPRVLRGESGEKWQTLGKKGSSFQTQNDSKELRSATL